MTRVNGATRCASSGALAFGFAQELLDLGNDAHECRPPQHRAYVIGVDLDRAVDLMVEPPRCPCRDDSVPP